MSGTKCVTYTVSHDGSGMSFAVARERNEMLRQKIARLRGLIAQVLVSHPGLVPRPIRDSLAVPVEPGDALALVHALNANQAIYNETAAALAALQDAAAVQDALARLDAVNRRTVPLSARIADHDKRHPTHPVGLRLTPVAAPANASAEHLNRLSQMQEVELDRALARLAAAEEAGLVSSAELAALHAERRDAAAAARAAQARIAANLAAQLSVDADDPARQRIAGLARRLAEAGLQGEQQAAEQTLRLAVTAENQRAASMAADKEEAALLLDRLARFQAPGTIRDALAAVERGDDRLDPDLRQAARDVLREAERKAAADRLATVFRDLGYTVHGSFHTLCARGGQVFAQADGWEAEYALSLAAAGENLTFDVVRVASPGERQDDGHRANRDRLAQERLCRDFAAICSSLGDGGMATQLVSAEAIGRPVAVVASHPFAARSGTTQAMPGLRARPLGEGNVTDG